ncbi:putative ABC transporter permease protein YurN [Paenibacillus baekrokdamisoli]|uniref:Putative ABC transporter permease protein YurN n=1 Tax=Paenibacillus baekrokdamisoli TaxID=1712516 RepID=A0A3G9JJ66_9BACL|nr:sugar ABC transporter permease [Paenibacillus baekrokdamisoli]MBB3067884.1 raffinose/stachyose/melibiose transport system permease protein [Paenibacillus baekrokdamisoli]BBH23069.1 putative ABC transporter permease protein YurN [Paenibacillus baekrokdamisoli]
MKNVAIKPRTLFLYLSIPVGLYFFMAIVPTFVSFYYSLFEWTGGSVKQFVWFDKYVELLRDDDFWFSFKNSTIFTLFMVIGQVGIAFVFALLFTMKWLRFKAFHRYVMFFPVVISSVVIGLMWQLIYNYDIGILNFILRQLGLEHYIMFWLDDPSIIMRTVAVPVIWQFVGFYLVILLSAIGSIPADLMESAEMDGASGWKRTLYVTIPMIYGTLKICITFCIIGSMKAFDHILVLTGGGPGKSSSVMGLYAYTTAFREMKLSYANAVSIGILLLTLLITLLIRSLLGGRKYES